MISRTNGWRHSLLFLVCVTVASSAPNEALSASPQTEDWPCWRGYDGTGRCRGNGEDLVDTLDQAKVVWYAREPIMQTYPVGCTNDVWITGGQCGPIVADGRVFQYYFEPSGKVVDEGFYAAMKQDLEANKARRQQLPAGVTPDAFARKKYAIGADDVVLCLDSETGKRLWKRTFVDRGINYTKSSRGLFIASKCGPLATPCAAYGRVYATGTSSMLYCIDAATGEPLWEDRIPRLYAFLMGKKISCLVSKSCYGPRWEDGGFSLSFANGVVCAPGGLGIVGWDAETGKRLWNVPLGDLSWAMAYPGIMRWVHKGKEYFVAGEAAPIDPLTGRALWHAYKGWRVLALSEDYWVVCRFRDTLRCIKVNETGFTNVWETPPAVEGGHRLGCISGEYMYLIPGGSNAENTFFAIHLPTGKVTTQITVYPDGNRASSSMAMYGNRAFVERTDLITAEDGKLSFRPMSKIPENIKPKDLQALVGHPELIHANTSTPATAGGRLYLRCHYGLACVDLRKKPSQVEEPADTLLPATLRSLPAPVQGLVSRYAGKRDEALVALRALPESNRIEMAGLLATAVKECGWPVAENVCPLIEGMGAKASQTAPILSECVQKAIADGRPELTTVSAKALAAVDPNAIDALKPVVVKALHEGTVAQKRAACAAIRVFGKWADAIVEDLTSMLKTQDPTLIGIACDALPALGEGAKPAVDTLKEFVSTYTTAVTSKPQSRYAFDNAILAMQTLGQMGKHAGDAQTLQSIFATFLSRSGDAQPYVVSLLAECGAPGAAVLLSATRTGSSVRTEALYAATQNKSVKKEAITAELELLSTDKDEQVAARARQLLEELTGKKIKVSTAKPTKSDELTGTESVDDLLK